MDPFLSQPSSIHLKEPQREVKNQGSLHCFANCLKSDGENVNNADQMQKYVLCVVLVELVVKHLPAYLCY